MARMGWSGWPVLRDRLDRGPDNFGACKPY